MLHEKKRQQETKPKKAESEEMCKVHKHPLSLFCEGCQDFICEACAVLCILKHFGEGGQVKVMDVNDKLKQVRENMKEIKSQIGIDKEMISYMPHDERRKRIETRINTSASEAMEKIKKKKEEQIKAVEEEAKIQTDQVEVIQLKELGNVDKYYKDLEERSKKLDSVSELINKTRKRTDAKEIIRQYSNVKKLHAEATVKSEYTPGKNTPSKAYSTADFNTQPETLLSKPVLGDVILKTYHIENDDLLSPYFFDTATFHEGTGNMKSLNPMGTAGSPTSALMVASWKLPMSPAEIHLSVSIQTGTIFCFTVDRTYDAIMAFDLYGNLKMKYTLPYYVTQGIICLNYNGRDLLVLSGISSVELRDGSTCKFLDKINIGGFLPGEGICNDSANGVFVSGKEGGHFKILEFIIREKRIFPGSKKITIPFDIRSLSCTIHNKKKILLAVCRDNSIVAIDYESEARIWKTRIEKRFYHPRTICSDGRNHLFLAEPSSFPIIILDMTGKEEGELDTVSQLDGYISDAAFIPNWNKLILSTCPEGGDHISVYDVEYKCTEPVEAGTWLDRYRCIIQ